MLLPVTLPTNKIVVIKHTFVLQEWSAQPPTSMLFHCVIFTDLLSVLKNSYKCFSIMVGFDTDTPGCLQSHHTPWKVCYYISQPTALVLMPVVHQEHAPEDTGLVQPLTWMWKAGTARVFHSPLHVGWQKASLRGHGAGINWRQPAMPQIYPRGQTSHQMRHRTGTSTSLLCITTPAAALGCQSLCELGCKMQDVHMERAQNCVTQKMY